LKKIYATILLLSLSIKIEAQRHQLNIKNDLAIIGSTVGLTLTPILFPHRKVVLDEALLKTLKKEDINFFDRHAAGNYNKNISNISDYTIIGLGVGLFASLPLKQELRQDITTYGVISIEAIILTSALTKLSKSYVTRWRPHIYSGSTLEEKRAWSSSYSFFSGHAANSFVTASLLHHIYPESPEKKYISIGAFGTATAISYMRYKSGAHFPTDLLLGAGIGTFIGWWVPHLHKSKSESSLSINAIPLPDGLLLSARLPLK
jgi:membrane-associated phospholipid phosphatase